MSPFCYTDCRYGRITAFENILYNDTENINIVSRLDILSGGGEHDHPDPARRVFYVKMRPVEPFKTDFFNYAAYADGLSRHGQSDSPNFAEPGTGNVLLRGFLQSSATHPCEDHGDEQQSEQSGYCKKQKPGIPHLHIVNEYGCRADKKSDPCR